MASGCRRADADSPWWCACGWNENTLTFELGQSSAEPAHVCSSASARCLELLPMVLGPTGEVVTLPDLSSEDREDEAL